MSIIQPDLGPSPDDLEALFRGSRDDLVYAAGEHAPGCRAGVLFDEGPPRVCPCGAIVAAVCSYCLTLTLCAVMPGREPCSHAASLS